MPPRVMLDRTVLSQMRYVRTARKNQRLEKMRTAEYVNQAIWPRLLCRRKAIEIEVGVSVCRWVVIYLVEINAVFLLAVVQYDLVSP